MVIPKSPAPLAGLGLRDLLLILKGNKKARQPCGCRALASQKDILLLRLLLLRLLLLRLLLLGLLLFGNVSLRIG